MGVHKKKLQGFRVTGNPHKFKIPALIFPYISVKICSAVSIVEFQVRAKYFLDAVFHQKSKTYDVASLLYFWLAKNSHFLYEVLTRLVITENTFFDLFQGFISYLIR